MIVVIVFASAAICYGLIVLLFPLLQRHMTVVPSERSSHSHPTPQGGGIAVVAATLAVAGVALAAIDGLAGSPHVLASLAAAMIAIATLGALDDVVSLPVVPRLAVQAICVSLVVVALGWEGITADNAIRSAAGAAVIIIAWLWFVNLTNFMDGLDWLTVAAVTPVTAALMLFGAAGFADLPTTVVAASLTGALIGFAPFNRPAAKLFLGDAGALPIGLLVGWMLLSLVRSGGVTAAAILPLYYVADASVTVASRALRGERPWQAHRGHFYQRANVNGLSALRISAHIFCLNCALALLAAVTLISPVTVVHVAAMAAAVGLVAVSLWRFSCSGQPSADS